MEQQSAVEWLIDELMPSIALQTKYIEELKEKAKEMEKQNEKNACLLAISKYLHKQAIKESEKNKVSENNDNTDQKEGIKIILRNLKGAIIKVDESWIVAHDFIDPYSQIPTQLPIHFNSYIATQLTENLKVDFDIVFQNNKYFALI